MCVYMYITVYTGLWCQRGSVVSVPVRPSLSPDCGLPGVAQPPSLVAKTSATHTHAWAMRVTETALQPNAPESSQ